MNNFKIDQLINYNIGTDIYPGKIISISPSGKTIKVASLFFNCKDPDINKHYYENDVYNISTSVFLGKILTFKLNKNNKYIFNSSTLKSGFEYYLDPSF